MPVMPDRYFRVAVRIIMIVMVVGGNLQQLWIPKWSPPLEYDHVGTARKPSVMCSLFNSTRAFTKCALFSFWFCNL